jgi:arylsulfatase A-like enzyme
MKKSGLDQTLIVLSGDHGAPEAPEYMASLGLSTGRFAFDWFKTEGPLTKALQKKFGRDDLIAGLSAFIYDRFGP